MRTLASQLEVLRNLSQENIRLGFGDRIGAVAEEYHYLVDFMRNGYDDPKRMELYLSLRHRAAVLEADITDAIAIQNCDYLASLKSSLKGVDASSASLVSMLRTTQSDALQHAQALETAFSAIIVSPQWTEQDSRLWTAYLLSTDTPLDTACVMVSAITISNSRVYSLEKFRTLVYVYLTSDQEALRQRALVGWCFTLCDTDAIIAHPQGDLLRELAEGQQELLNELADEGDKVRNEVLEMLMQTVRCSQTEKDNTTFEKDIMPTLMEGNPVKVTREGIVEKEDDPMEDILNPGASEQRMEQMEKSIQKMLNMQKDGSDLYYKGFSQMKRYPFFYKIHNWFVPFSIDIPDVNAVIQKSSTPKFLKRILNEGPFCDSDKFSLVFTFSHVMDHISDKIKQMMEEGELAPVGMMPEGQSHLEDPAYIRRMYLQNLYRFFRLFPQYKFGSFFENQMSRVLFLLDNISAAADDTLKIDFGKFLVRREEYDFASAVIDGITVESYDAYMLKGAWYQSQDVVVDAIESFRKALSAKPDDPRALNGVGRNAFAMGDYSLAAESFRQLKTLEPDNLSYEKNYLMALINSGKAAEIINDVYRLDFQQPDNLSVKRILGWALLLAKRPEQADKVLSAICREDFGEAQSVDILNLAYVKWVSNDVPEAIALLKNYVHEECRKWLVENPDQKLMSIINRDQPFLDAYNLTPLDVTLLLDCVFEKYY